MIRITDSDIRKLRITPEMCYGWVKESFRVKYDSTLPPKTSIHLHESDFFNTMPCLLPERFDTFSVKVVSRIKGQDPALKSDILLYKASTGELLSLIEADWITAMRTGAVAALAIETLKRTGSEVYSFMGLGSTAKATFACLAPHLDRNNTVIRLLRYKDHAEKFIMQSSHTGLHFEIYENVPDLIHGADVAVSCITSADGILCPDESLFKPGVLVVPVHTRGFQNCDAVFDKVFADDTGHVDGFANFSKFRKFNEIGEVLSGTVPGRESSTERILSYNIGLGLHDAYFACRIYNMVTEGSLIL